MTTTPIQEREFGVPIPGEILPPQRWARTGLKMLPPEGALDVAAIFGRQAPLVVDVGCGNGRYLLGSAGQRPDHDHLGVDILPLVLRYATRRGNQRGLGNLRFACVDGQTLVQKYLSEGSVRELHCYHPQPYHDARDMEKRLLMPRWVAQMWRVLEPAGRFFVQTDNAPYWVYLQQIMPAFFDFHEMTTPWPDTPRGRTRREIIALRKKLPIFRAWCGKRPDLDGSAVLELAKSLPPPLFDAGPRRPDVDALEKE
jgi:tRNA (guanine-N7-)-methyltransferase